MKQPEPPRKPKAPPGVGCSAWLGGTDGMVQTVQAVKKLRPRDALCNEGLKLMLLGQLVIGPCLLNAAPHARMMLREIVGVETQAADRSGVPGHELPVHIVGAVGQLAANRSDIGGKEVAQLPAAGEPKRDERQAPAGENTQQRGDTLGDMLIHSVLLLIGVGLGVWLNEMTYSRVGRGLEKLERWWYKRKVPPNDQELSHATCDFRTAEVRSAKLKAPIALAPVMC